MFHSTRSLLSLDSIYRRASWKSRFVSLIAKPVSFFAESPIKIIGESAK